jgi:hypothetical protein
MDRKAKPTHHHAPRQNPNAYVDPTDVLRVPIHHEHKSRHTLSGAFEILESIEKDSRTHRVEHDEFEVEEDDDVGFFDDDDDAKEDDSMFAENNPGCWVRFKI